MSGFLGRWLVRVGLGRVAVAFGLGALPSGAAPAAVPIVSVCGDTVISSNATGRTHLTGNVTGLLEIVDGPAGSTHIAGNITGSSPISNC